MLCLPARAFGFPADVANVCFSPYGGCTRLIVHEINHAQKEIRVLAYDFTSVPIGKALIRAKRRGVSVEVVMDRPGALNEYSEVPYLTRVGIPVYADSHEMMQHNKVMIIDGETVITGSFNFTKAAEYDNAENLLIIKSPELARKYLENWRLHAGHSRRMQ
ncbi:MAG: phospholipase D family protein [Nitrospiraceae bacterium]|nr:phospholipase D family protein [Nitrospiraceae bacterium]